MPLLVVDNGDGSATVAIPVCARDALFQVEVNESQTDLSSGHASFSGDLDLNATDGTASFDLSPAVTEWPALAGLKVDSHGAYKTVPTDFRGLGALFVDTFNSTAYVRLDRLPPSASGAWLVAPDIAGGDVTSTALTDGEAIINSWCADQRASASGK